jgi:predicted CoA-binding protein
MHGYQILSVNPRGGQILGQHVHPSLAAVNTPVDVVDVFRPRLKPAVTAVHSAVCRRTRKDST